jgi:hypothetical protein
MKKAIGLLFFLLIQSAHADVVLPMFAFTNPVLVVLIIPIVLIEYAVMKRYLPKINSKKIFSTATISNILSSIIGYPFLMLVSALPIGLFFEIAIRPIFDNLWVNSWGGRMVLYCILIVLVAFFLSYRIEYIITRRCLQKKYSQDMQTIKNAVKYANIYSYAFLTVCAVLLEMYSLYFHKNGFLLMYYYHLIASTTPS